MGEVAREVLGVLLIGLLVVGLAYCLNQPTRREWDEERQRACLKSGGIPVVDQTGQFQECQLPRWP